MMSTRSDLKSHRVGVCRWQTGFDDESRAFALQQRLSDWSDLYLAGILGDGMNAVCSNGETLRLDTLTLDLGPIPLASLERELPRMVADALREALRRLPTDAGVKRTGNADGSRIPDVDSCCEALDGLLERGTLPWWAEASLSHAGMVERLLAEEPEQLTRLVRQTGSKSESRKRIALQWRDRHVRQLVHLLEPANGAGICAYADALDEMHKQSSSPLRQLGSSAFRRYKWFWILTHLLVERGTFFNTVAFVQSTIAQMARHFNVAYHDLLLEMAAALEHPPLNLMVPPVFMRAIGVLAKQEAAERSCADVPDLWQAYSEALATAGDAVVVAAEKTLPAFATLHARLMASDAARVIAMLKRNDSTTVAAVLAHSLPAALLEKLAAVMVPQQIGVLRQLQRSVTMAAAVLGHRLPSLWQMTLAHLLAGKPPVFTPAAWLDDVLRRIEREHGMARADLLVCLSDDAKLQHESWFAALMQPLWHTASDAVPVSGAAPVSPRTAVMQLALAAYLQQGRAGRYLKGQSLSRQKTLLRHYLLQHPRQALSAVRRQTSRTVALAYCARLLELGGPAAYATLLGTVPGLDVALVIALPRLLRRRAGRGAVAGLRSVDGHFDLPVLCLYTALQLHGAVGTRQFLRELARQATAGMPEAAFDSVLTQTLVVAGQMIDDGERGKLDAQATAVWRLLNGKPPAALAGSGSHQCIDDFMRSHARRMRALLLTSVPKERAIYRCSQLLALDTLGAVVSAEKSWLAVPLRQLLAFIQRAGKLPLPGADTESAASHVRRLMLECWLDNQWNSGSVNRLLVAYLMLLRRSGNGSELPLQALLHELGIAGADALIVRAGYPGRTKKTVGPVAAARRPQLRKQSASRSAVPAVRKVFVPEGRTAMHIGNAGLVLCADYIKPYFERLGLVRDNAFVGEEAQGRAVHYLQLLATGANDTEEHHLPLNRLLCGLSPQQAVPLGIEVEKHERELAASLIDAMIAYWSAIGASSIDGFRGNWLVREATLEEQDANWTLNMAKRAYDVLLRKAPFGFSVIRLPWMSKPLYTNWPY
ncbi:MAG TPA: contractile injection system tape measure protein [Candidatus Acidoferrum sp.]|nr:contractile injection system tape measure protein [Candidatus Acidoferrum sp.]